MTTTKTTTLISTMTKGLSCFLLGMSSLVSAQEQLRPLSGNIELIRYNQEHPAQLSSGTAQKTAAVAPDTIPFFDDFSYAYKQPYADQSKWIGYSVYVNNGLGYAPPSIGVASLDGLNPKGYPYNPSVPSTISTNADTLLSRPINLEKHNNYIYSPADSIYLSFYYQPEGYGDAPEPVDSLILELFKPNQNKWQRVWSVKGFNPGDGDSTFYRQMIAIKDSAYFDSAFQFRFRNKATTSGSLDHWNIDYIYLNMGRSWDDTLFEDVSFVYMPGSFLKNYSVMPYKHFIPSEMGLNFKNTVYNSHNTLKQATYEFAIHDKSGALLINNFNGPCNISPQAYDACNQHASPPIGYIFPNPLTDTTYFNIRHIVNTTPDFARGNDTIIEKQMLWNYFAYDDGSAEQAYYMNTYGAMAAYRVTLNVQDTLRAMDIFFDPISNISGIQTTTFRICVWQVSQSGNGPGTRILRDSTRTPVFLQDGYNAVPRFPLTSGFVMTPGTYYIGMQQTTNVPLNVGFDRNRDYHEALYFNVTGTWQQSAIAGSLMMHPVFGSPALTVGIDEPGSAQALGRKAFRLYPNPANEQVTIQLENKLQGDCQVEFYNSMGQLVKTASLANPTDVSDLTNGLYHVVVKQQQQYIGAQPLMIAR